MLTAKHLVQIPATIDLRLNRLGPFLVGHVLEGAITQYHGALHDTPDLASLLSSQLLLHGLHGR